ncbi:MAG: hypothetical protein ACRDRL_27125 [Sciscionella sp.]
MSAPGHLHHFLLLDQEQQAQAIKRMAATGWSDNGIATATGLSVEQIRRILAEHSPTPGDPS